MAYASRTRNSRRQSHSRAHRRFGLQLSDGARSLDALTEAFAAAVVAQDTAAMHVIATECRRGVTAYESFAIHGDCWVVWEAPEGGRDTVKLFGSIVEVDGRYKVVGIIED